MRLLRGAHSCLTGFGCQPASLVRLFCVDWMGWVSFEFSMSVCLTWPSRDMESGSALPLSGQIASTPTACPSSRTTNVLRQFFQKFIDQPSICDALPHPQAQPSSQPSQPCAGRLCRFQAARPAPPLRQPRPGWARHCKCLIP